MRGKVSTYYCWLSILSNFECDRIQFITLLGGSRATPTGTHPKPRQEWSGRA